MGPCPEDAVLEAMAACNLAHQLGEEKEDGRTFWQLTDGALDKIRLSNTAAAGTPAFQVRRALALSQQSTFDLLSQLAERGWE